MQLVKIGDLLARRKDPIFIQDGKRYKRVTIRINHNGVCLRNEEIGKKIGTKRQFLTRAGDFILSRIDARHAAFGIVPEALEGAIITNDFWTFEINKELVDLEYFYTFSQSEAFLEACKKASKGTTNRKRIEEDFFLNYEFRLPDKKAQHEIVERYKSAKALQDKLYRELNNQKRLTDKLKQSILIDAIRGKLIAQNADEETGGKLLEKILKRKEVLIQKKLIKKRKAITPLRISMNFPASWEAVTIDQIMHNMDSGWSPDCKNSPTDNESEWGVLKTTAVQPLFFDQNAHKALPKHLAAREELELKGGELLLTRAGPANRVGIACVVPTDVRKHLMISDKIIRVNLDQDVDPKYVAIALSSGSSKQTIEILKTGMAQSQVNISQDKYRSISIPLAPNSEQKKIVKRISEIMSFCSSIELEEQNQLAYSEKLASFLLRDLFQETAL